jgi:tripartite-type tricarboxylate transporter receptor subunit TctC
VIDENRGSRFALSIRACFWIVFTGLLFSATSVLADDDFRGKTLTLVVGGDPGGYDSYARLLMRHLSGHLPGEPTIIIQNMPGAGGLRAADYIYEIAPKDGTMIGAGFGGIATAQLFKIPGVRFDPRQFRWLGSMSSDVGLVLAWHTAPVKTIKDAFERELIIGGSGQTSANVVFPTVMNKVLGTKFKIVTGYKGGSDIALAMQRGEIEGVGSVYYSSLITRNPDWLADHLVNVLVQLSLKPYSRFQGVPAVVDLARTPEDRALLELVFAQQEMSRPFMLPPGTPEKVVGVLQHGFAETLKDPAFLDDAAKQTLEIDNPMTGEDIRVLIDRLYSASPDVIARGAAASAGKL